MTPELYKAMNDLKKYNNESLANQRVVRMKRAIHEATNSLRCLGLATHSSRLAVKEICESLEASLADTEES